MLSWLAKQIIGFAMARLRQGDLRPIMLLDAKDVQMTFPGQSSWAIVLHSRREHERWLRRFADVGLQIFPDEVIAKGLPWNITICVRGHVYLRTHSGELVYENRYVIWGRLRWLRLAQYEVYEDTHKTERLDEWLQSTARVGAAG
jgi:hypothetical protein